LENKGILFLKIKHIIFVLATLVSSQGYSKCKLERIRRNTNIYFNLQEGKTFKTGRKINLPGSVFKNCKRNEERRFLRVDFGVEVPRAYNPNASSVFSTGEIKLDTVACKIQNNSFKNSLTIKELEQIYEEKRNLLTSCLDIIVKDLNPKGILFPKDQEHCEIKRIDQFTALIKGGRCFVGLNKNSNIIVSAFGKKECAQRESLKSMGINPQEVMGTLSFSTTLNPVKPFKKVSNLGFTNLNVEIDPDDIIPTILSYYKDKIFKFPSTWVYPDIQLGKIILKKSGKDISLKVPMFINNQCPKKCRDGLCTGTCYYSTPLAGEYNFLHLRNGKWEYLKSGFFGRKIPPNYQGQIDTLISYKEWDSKIKLGEKFKLEVNFYDPREDYQFFRRLFASKIPGITGGIPDMFNGGGMPSIGRLGASHELPTLGNLGDFSRNSSSSISDSVDSTIDSFDALFTKGGYWPPYYENICGPEEKNCHEYGKLKVNTILTNTFIITGKKDSEGKPLPMEGEESGIYTTGEYFHERKSHLMEDLKENKLEGQFPFVDCSK